jgi:hypothetical protein
MNSRLTRELVTARRLRKNNVVRIATRLVTEQLWDYLVERFKGAIVYENNGTQTTFRLCC